MKKLLISALIVLALVTVLSFSSAVDVPTSLCDPGSVCFLSGYVDLEKQVQSPTPTFTPEQVAEEMKDAAKSPYANLKTPPKLSPASEPISYAALYEVPLMAAKARWNREAYAACVAHLDETIDAAKAACGGKTVYNNVNIVIAITVLAYTESHCGTRGKIYLGVKGKSGDAATQIPAAARILCRGLDGKGAYEGCDTNPDPFYCVLNRYTPEGIEGNAPGYNAMRVDVAGRLKDALSQGAT